MRKPFVKYERGYIEDITSSGYSRLSCPVCGRSVVDSPIRGEANWRFKKAKFMAGHKANCEPTDARTR